MLYVGKETELNFTEAKGDFFFNAEVSECKNTIWFHLGDWTI